MATLDVSTDIGKVRVIIHDRDESALLLEDEEIQTFLDLEGDVRLAAAAALDTIASNQALVLKKMVMLDLRVDGPAVAEALRTHAKQLRDQAQSSDIFEVIEMVDTTFAQDEKVWKDAEREN